MDSHFFDEDSFEVNDQCLDFNLSKRRALDSLLEERKLLSEINCSYDYFDKNEQDSLYDY